MSFSKNEIATGDMFRHVYSQETKDSLDQKIEQLLNKWDYRRIARENDLLIYEKGSRTKRLLFGAFVKYSKISVATRPTGPDEVTCEVRSKSTGFSGGLIGVSQVTDEIRNLFTAFQQI